MTNQPTSNILYAQSNSQASSNPFIEIFQTRNPTAQDISYPVQKRWFNTANNTEWILTGFTTSNGVISATWQAISGTVAVPLPVASGGTGSTSFNTNGVVISGTTPTSPLTALSLTNGQIVIGSSVGPPLASTITAGSGITISNGPNNITISTAGSPSGIVTIDGDAGNVTGATVTISGGSTGLTTGCSGTTMSLTGTLNVGHGGTAATTFTAYAPVCAGTTATGAFQSASTGLSTSGYVLTSNGSGVLPSFQIASASGAVTSLTADDSSVASPSMGTITVSGGTTGLTTTASGAKLSITGVLDLANGGTNANLTASNGGIFYSTASAGAILSGTATAHQVLLSGSSTTPAWSTATYPATTTINQLLYSSSNNVIGGITAGNDGVLISSHTGVPSWLANGTAGFVLTANSGAPPSWQAASGGSGITTINGNSGSITGTTVTINGGSTGLTTSCSGTTMSLTGTLVVANGGTGDSSVTAYAPICGGTTTTGAFQSASTGISNSGYVLTSNGSAALPTWQAAGGGFTSVSVQLSNSQLKNLHSTPVQILAAQGAGVVIVAVSVVIKFDYGGSNPFTNSTPPSINLGYSTSMAPTFFGTGGAVNFIASSNQYGVAMGIDSPNSPSGALIWGGAATRFENIAIYAQADQNFTGNAANDNTVWIRMVYYTVSIA